MLWYSLEAPLRGASNKYPQHMFLYRNNEKKKKKKKKKLNIFG